MPTRQLNYTGRKRITQQDVSVVLNDETTPITFEIQHLSLERFHFPPEAIVRLEAYRQSLYVPFELGTVSSLTTQGIKPLHDFALPDGIRFRVKVTSVAKPTDGQLLAVGDRILPNRVSGTPESLLHVKPDELGQEVFRLSWEPGPVLLINEKIELWRDAARDPSFISLAYPAILRTILSRILRESGSIDDDADEDWASQWLNFAKGLPNVGSPPDVSSEEVDEIEGWINCAVSVFCRRNSIYNVYSGFWGSKA